MTPEERTELIDRLDKFYNNAISTPLKPIIYSAEDEVLHAKFCTSIGIPPDFFNNNFSAEYVSILSRSKKMKSFREIIETASDEILLMINNDFINYDSKKEST